MIGLGLGVGGLSGPGGAGDSAFVATHTVTVANIIDTYYGWYEFGGGAISPTAHDGWDIGNYYVNSSNVMVLKNPTNTQYDSRTTMTIEVNGLIGEGPFVLEWATNWYELAVSVAVKDYFIAAVGTDIDISIA